MANFDLSNLQEFDMWSLSGRRFLTLVQPMCWPIYIKFDTTSTSYLDLIAFKIVAPG